MRSSVAVAIPVTVTIAPTVFAFPSLAITPAAFAGLAKLMALMVGLTAVKAVAIDLALQLPFLLVNAALTFVEIVSVSPPRGAEQQKPANRRSEQGHFPTLGKCSCVAPRHNGLPATNGQC
jgi:hypothetical protein